MSKREMMREIRGLKTKVRKLELFADQVAKLLELSREGALVDPLSYARDELDKKMILVLLLHKVATAPEIAKMVGEPDRFKVTKRLQRYEKESISAGEQWLRFEPKQRFGHFRAWWLITEVIEPKLLSPIPDAISAQLSQTDEGDQNE